MKKTLFILLAGLGIPVLLFTSCNPEEGLPPVNNTPCGDDLAWFSDLDIAQHLRSSSVEDGMRVFKLEDFSTPADMCTNTNSVVTFTASLANGAPGENFTFSGRGYWGSAEKIQAMDYDVAGSKFTSSYELDITNTFPNGPGYVGLQMSVMFPTQGSAEADKAYLADHISSMRIDLDYAKYKEPE